MFTCPVCFYGKMSDAPANYNICPCCGTEFGADDELFTHAELRETWMSEGSKWFLYQQPPFWNPWKQLAEAGIALPYTVSPLSFVALGSSQSVLQTRIGSSFSLTFPEHEVPPFARAA